MKSLWLVCAVTLCLLTGPALHASVSHEHTHSSEAQWSAIHSVMRNDEYVLFSAASDVLWVIVALTGDSALSRIKAQEVVPITHMQRHTARGIADHRKFL